MIVKTNKQTNKQKKTEKKLFAALEKIFCNQQF